MSAHGKGFRPDVHMDVTLQVVTTRREEKRVLIILSLRLVMPQFLRPAKAASIN